VLGILCAGIGCIVGIVYVIQGKPKGFKMVLLSICAWLTLSILWTIFAALVNLE
jgi:hypothetical protein